MVEMKKISKNVVQLPRGGYLIDTPIGSVQLGSPPETIKDTMLLPNGVPDIFVLSDKLFDWEKGISIAEIEFPLYYNFFIKKKKTTIICTRDQYKRIIKVLHEAVFGPKKVNISSDYNNPEEDMVPDIGKEMEFFRNNLKLSDLLSIGLFKDNSFTLKGLTIKRYNLKEFQIFYQNELVAAIPRKIEYKATYKIGERLPEPYHPPLFGVTCLGPSHGFDPEENTSGFIIWLNHQGIMVDPPVNSTEWLEDSNVNPKFIDSIILTHCHADHDAGTFQKILEEGKITIYTTETVMQSFLRKYASLTKLNSSYLMKLFDFHPIKIGKPVFINGGQFNMFYTLHSIPTIGFKMNFQDQSFVYSSDHNNDPAIHEQLLREDVITQERYNELRKFPWESKVIYHESGIAPLHTPIKLLNSLSEEIRKKIVVYHIAKKDFPEQTDLVLAEFGIEKTLYFKTTPPPFENAYQILGLFKHIDFFNDLPISKAQDFINIVDVEHYKKGDRIIKKGTQGDKFYIIHSGNISVDSGDLKENKIYGAYDYFGEVALVTEQTRAADVFAETDVTAYTISRDKFLNFIVGTEFEKVLKRLAKIRSSETWNLLSTSPFFKYCTSSQKTWLESMFVPLEIDREGILLKEGDKIEFLYIIREGEVIVSRADKEIARLKRGDFIGEMIAIHKNTPSEYTFKHNKKVLLFSIKRDKIYKFANNNPGLLMKIIYSFDKN